MEFMKTIAAPRCSRIVRAPKDEVGQLGASRRCVVSGKSCRGGVEFSEQAALDALIDVESVDEGLRGSFLGFVKSLLGSARSLLDFDQ
jgi:hypothetical protein